MRVSFRKNVTYRSRVGTEVVMSLSWRSEKRAIVALEREHEYPMIEEASIQESDDGKEFIDVIARGIRCRLWATDIDR